MAKRDWVFAKTGGRCIYCGADLGEYWHVDHLYPKSRGGCWDCIENLVPACASCNVDKSTLTLPKWKDKIRRRLRGYDGPINFWFEDDREYVTWSNGRLIMAVSQERWDYYQAQGEKQKFLSKIKN
jgi:hypothetical protein